MAEKNTILNAELPVSNAMFEMKDKLLKAYKKANNDYLDYLESIDQKGLVDTDGKANFIVERLLEEGVYAPPVKVGTVVYAVSYNTNTFSYGVHRGYVASINFRQDGNKIIISHEGLDDEPFFNNIVCDFEDFHKFVFFDKEKALEYLKTIKR